MELAPRSVQRAIAYLEERGFIRRTFDRFGGRIRKTIYTFVDGVTESPLMASESHHQENLMVSQSPVDGVTESPPIYKEVLNDNITTKEKAKKNNANAKTEGELIAIWEADPDYAGIDIRKEVAGMRRWLKRHPSRKFTRRFAERWLNGADREIKPEPSNKPEPDLMSADYQNSAPMTFELTLLSAEAQGKLSGPQDYTAVRDWFLAHYPARAGQIKEYERSNEYRDRFAEAKPAPDGTFAETSRGNGVGPAKTPLSVS